VLRPTARFCRTMAMHLTEPDRETSQELKFQTAAFIEFYITRRTVKPDFENSNENKVPQEFPNLNNKTSRELN